MEWYSQPVKLRAMGAFEQKLVNDSVYPNRSTDQFLNNIGWILKDEMVAVEVS